MMDAELSNTIWDAVFAAEYRRNRDATRPMTPVQAAREALKASKWVIAELERDEREANACKSTS